MHLLSVLILDLVHIELLEDDLHSLLAPTHKVVGTLAVCGIWKGKVGRCKGALDGAIVAGEPSITGRRMHRQRLASPVVPQSCVDKKIIQIDIRHLMMSKTRQSIEQHESTHSIGNKRRTTTN